MVIGIWIAVIVCIILILGEIKYRCFDKKDVLRESNIVFRDWKDNVDADMDKLTMEDTNDEFVSSQTLAMRGSWRLAQNQVMGKQAFSSLRTEEYAKML